MGKSLVRSSRVYELDCDNHGVLESHGDYEYIKIARLKHKRESPECFGLPAGLYDDDTPHNKS